jgi:tetratricopeptide (TPR) repeat protein
MKQETRNNPPPNSLFSEQPQEEEEEDITMGDCNNDNSTPPTTTASSSDPQEEEEEEDWKIQLEANKSLGDASFRSGDYPTAIQHYTAALSLDPTHAILLSNRSAAYLKNGEKSKALHDARQIEDRMGLKGTSRLAAALQSLGRFAQAMDEWDRIMQQDANHAAALDGKKVCQEALEKQEQQQLQQEQEKEVTKEESKPEDDTEEDSLDDFFNDVEDAAVATKEQELKAEEPVATEAIRSHKKDLGTVSSQMERLLAPNYKWRNLNPFFVVDLPHTATADHINRRYKALSLLLHPDKNLGPEQERAQEAYDQVLQAKAKLADEHKAKHVRQLIEAGRKQGKDEWEKQHSKDASLLKDLQAKAVHKIFATAEYNRKEVEQRERNQEQRERKQEEDELGKERQSREFDKQWKDDTRVDNRIGNWRDFAKKAKKQKKNP